MHAHASQRAFAPTATLRDLPVRFFGFVMRWCFVATLVYVLYVGWINRNERHLTPEEGVGYWLGIAGVTALVFLLIYPIRKRLPFVRWMGSTPFWFRLHMGLGLVAPTLILLHCNFKFGSANSSMALSSMLIVAMSGIVGRYLYGRVYRNLIGGRIEAASFFDDIPDEDGEMIAKAARERLGELADAAIAPHRSLNGALNARLRLPGQARRLAAKVRKNAATRLGRGGTRAQKRQNKRQLADLEQWLRAYQRAIQQACSLAVHERAFALWHVLHLPLFFLLIVAVVVHVTAVHFY